MSAICWNLVLVGSLLAQDGATGPTSKPLKSGVATLPPASRAARIALSCLDFEGARAAREELRAAMPDKPFAADEVDVEIEAARAAWAAITNKLEERKRDRKTLSLAFPANPREPMGVTARACTIVELSGRRLRVQPQGARAPETRSILSLSREALSELVGLAKDASPDLRQGLGILLLLHRGPEPARSLLLDASLPEATRKSNEAKLVALSDLWLHARLEGAARLAEEFKAASPSPAVDALEFLATDAAEIMAAWRSRGDYEKVRRKLRKIYIDAREEAIKASPPERNFHAKDAKVKGGSIELTYDFSTKEQLEDFSPVRSVTTKLEWVKAQKSMKLSGEVRFMDGNPFRSRVSILGKASGFDASQPNVNLALWTGEKDVVSMRDVTDLRSFRGDEKGADTERRDAYFVLGMGFKLDLGLERTGNKDLTGIFRNLKTFLPGYLREPSFLLLGCEAGKSALSSQRDVIWDASATNVLKGSFVFTASIDEKGKLDWSVNRKPLGFEASAESKRLAAAGSRTGSISFFSNGDSIQISQLKILGDLDPEWQLSRAHGLAVHEVRKLDGELPSTAEPKKKSPVEPQPSGQE